MCSPEAIGTGSSDCLLCVSWTTDSTRVAPKADVYTAVLCLCVPCICQLTGGQARVVSRPGSRVQQNSAIGRPRADQQLCICSGPMLRVQSLSVMVDSRVFPARCMLSLSCIDLRRCVGRLLTRLACQCISFVRPQILLMAQEASACTRDTKGLLCHSVPYCLRWTALCTLTAWAASAAASLCQFQHLATVL